MRTLHQADGRIPEEHHAAHDQNEHVEIPDHLGEYRIDGYARYGWKDRPEDLMQEDGGEGIACICREEPADVHRRDVLRQGDRGHHQCSKSKEGDFFYIPHFLPISIQSDFLPE